MYLEVLQIIFLDVLGEIVYLYRADHCAECKDRGAISDRAFAVEGALGVEEDDCDLKNKQIPTLNCAEITLQPNRAS